MSAAHPPSLGSDHQGDSPTEARRYAGIYVYVGTDAERARVQAAVDTATEGMIGKGIASHELMKRSEIRPSYSISFDENGDVSVQTPGYPSETSPLNGTEVKLTTKYGDVVENSQQFVDGALLQRGRTNDGSGSTQFRLQSDGNTLLVTRVSGSPKLPRPVEFTLTYVRHPQPLESHDGDPTGQPSPAH